LRSENVKNDMLIIEIREGENIDKALKRYKRKFNNTGLMRQLRGRREFTKPSIKRRHEVIKAAYREQIRREADEA
jgi:small subunit ribosomal protein S21